MRRGSFRKKKYEIAFLLHIAKRKRKKKEIKKEVVKNARRFELCLFNFFIIIFYILIDTET